MKKTIARSKYSRALIVPLALTVGMFLAFLSVSATYADHKPTGPNPGKGEVFGPEWYLQPSSSGSKSARNVIVLRGDRGGTGGCQEVVYVTRVYLRNTELLTVDNSTGSVTPDEIYIVGFVCALRGSGTVIYQAEYVYALPTDPHSLNPQGAFESAQGTELNEDFDIDGALDDNNNSWDYTVTYSSNPLASSQLTHELEIYREGNKILTANNFSAVISELPFPLEIGAPVNKTFENVIVATHGSYGDGPGGHIRFHAKGVGLVQLVRHNTFDDPVYNNQSKSEAIFYRIDGVSVGDLGGTPFDGGVSAGLWFTP